MKYDFKKIERKWQLKWDKEKLYQVDVKNSAKPFYNLMMFPYPSAEGLHVGNMYAFTGSDIYGRYQRLKGNDVFEPIGLDGFGIHSENFAIKNKIHPAKMALKTQKRFYEQLHMIGNAYDWPKTLETYDPEYYKWTQWLFLQMYKKGLAYKKKAAVNWCPSCMTVLSDEQVIKKSKVKSQKSKVQVKNQKESNEQIDVCERCGTEVIKKEMSQWFFKITDYAEKLLKNIDKIDWTEKTKLAQKNWIGRSEGIEINYLINSKCNFVLLHGYTGSSKDDFFPWLKEKLEKQGCDVFAPDLPNTKDPNEDEQVDFVLKNAKFDENTILLGHSLGAVVAMKVMEKLDNKIAGLVLVGGFVEPEFKDHSRSFTDKFNWKFDFVKIKNSADIINVISDINDHIIPLEQGKLLRDKLSANLTETVAEKNHFNNVEAKSVWESIFPEIKVFTTRPDTNFGATFVVLTPENKILSSITTSDHKREVDDYVKKSLEKGEQNRIEEGREKTGVSTGAYCINSLTGKKMPIWVSDFVLGNVGTGAVVGVPGHDIRDFEFAKKFELPIIRVVVGKDNDVSEIIEAKQVQEEEGKMINSDFLNGLDIHDATKKIMDYLEEKGWGKKVVNYKLRDWCISRQRFWGPPIPIVYCDNCKKNIEEKSFELRFRDKNSFADLKSGLKTVESRALNPEEKDRYFGNLKIGDYIKALSKITGEKLYFEITKIYNFKNLNELFEEKELLTKILPNKTINSVNDLEKLYVFNDEYLAKINENGLIAWEIKNVEPGVLAVPEKDLPVMLPKTDDYLPDGTDRSPLARNSEFVNTKCPKCGGDAKRETDVSDTFLDSSWYFLRYPSVDIKDQPFDKDITKKWLPVDMYIGGHEHAVLHLLYTRFVTMVLHDLGMIDFEEPFKKFRAHGLIIKDGAKMSKSKGNVVNPDIYIERYGADVLRTYLMFIGPLKQGGDFRDEGVVGIERFFGRLYYLVNEFIKSPSLKAGLQDGFVIERNKLIKKATHDIEELDYNTIIASLMEFLNLLDKNKEKVAKIDLETLIIILSSFAPHFCEEMWSTFASVPSATADKRDLDKYKQSVFRQKWPEFDESKMKEEKVKLIIQVNGKVRDFVEVEIDISESKASELVQKREKIMKFIVGKKIKKMIFVKGRLINIVL